MVIQKLKGLNNAVPAGAEVLSLVCLKCGDSAQGLAFVQQALSLSYNPALC